MVREGTAWTESPECLKRGSERKVLGSQGLIFKAGLVRQRLVETGQS